MPEIDTHGIAISLDWTALADTVKGPIGDTYFSSAEAAYARVSDGIFDQANDRAVEYAEARGAEMVGMKWVDGELVENPDAEWVITETTRDTLNQLIQDAFEEGKTPEELAQAIEDSEDFSIDRARNIARTELADAQSAGELEAMKESGVVTGKRWLIGGDSCDICQENADAGTIDLGEDFPSGDDAPTAHNHCVCALAYSVEGEDDE
jgi:hypothetical protein